MATAWQTCALLVLLVASGVAVMQVHAVSVCPTIFQCAALGQGCGSFNATYVNCNSGLFRNYSSSDSTCTCSRSMSYTLGASCTSDQVWANHVCTTDPYHGNLEKRWYSKKRIGDVCTTAAATTAYDCYPPRYCLNGKCASNLQLGDVCWNQTVSSRAGYFGICPINAYCRTYSLVIGILIDIGHCEARRELGEKCPYTNEDRHVCADGLTCVGATQSSAGTCGVPVLFVLPGGAVANYSSQCQSGQVNTTDGTCLDYTTMYAAAEAKKGLACNDTTNCGATADAAASTASCDCNNMGTQNAAVCSGYRLASPTKLLSQQTAMRRSLQQLYAAGCETSDERGSVPTDSITANWCARFDYDPEAEDFCTVVRQALAAGVKDCSGEYTTLCGGALHSMSVSLGLVVALMLASLVAA